MVVDWARWRAPQKTALGRGQNARRASKIRNPNRFQCLHGFRNCAAARIERLRPAGETRWRQPRSKRYADAAVEPVGFYVGHALVFRVIGFVYPSNHHRYLSTTPERVV